MALHDSPPLASPGNLINDRYRVIELIGKGAMGEVYVVEDKAREGELVALKYMKIDPEYKPALEHFKSEFDTMTHLNHPHIAQVFDFEWDSYLNYYFFTSELIDGRDFVNSAINLDIEQVETLLIQALRALEYLHGHKIYHFDIKPQNILVIDAGGPSPSVKIIDFGLASATPPEKLVGTPSYIAPEIIEGGTPDGRADLYSLAVLTYFALTKKNPYRGANKDETLNNHLTIIPPKPSTINPAIPDYLDAIIMKLLEKKPEDRYDTPAKIIHDINFRSPRFYAIETPDTLMSYVPWEGPFVGRDKEIKAFKKWLEEIEYSDAPALFQIKGDLGTGKSRFSEECKKTAQLLNFNTLSTNKVDYTFLNRLEKSAELTLIIIDDFDKLLDNADPGSLEMLKTEIKERPIFITTNDESDNRIDNFFRSISEEENQKVTLRNFSIKELREYIKTLTGLAEVPGWLIKNLYISTSGNPFLITEIMKKMISSGLLFDQAGRWKKTTFEDMGVNFSYIDIPNSILERLKKKTANLTKDDYFVLAILSAWNGNIDATTLNKIAHKECSREISRLSGKAITTYDQHRHFYTFRNIILKNGYYNIVPKRIKEDAHDRIVKYLTGIGGDKNLIRYHVQRGSDNQRARAALLEEINENRDVFSKAVDIFIERFGSEKSDDIFEVYIMMAKRNIALRNYDAAEKIYNDLLERFSDKIEEPEKQFKINIELSSLYNKKRKPKEAIVYLKRAREIAERLKDAEYTITVENHLAGLDMALGNIDTAIERYRIERDQMEDLEKEKRNEIGRNDLGHAYFYKGDYSKAIDVLKNDIKFFREQEQKKELARALYTIGESYRHLRKHAKAKETFEELIHLTKEINDTERLYRAYNGLGNVLSDEGNFADSIGYFERAFDLAIHLSDYDAAVSNMINIGIIHSNIDEIKEAFATLRTTLSFLERGDFPVSMRTLYLCRTHLELGELYRLQKKYNEARDHLDEALSLAKKPEGKFYLFWVLITQAKLAKDIRKKRKAKGIIRKAKKIADSPNKKQLLSQIKKYVKEKTLDV